MDEVCVLKAMKTISDSNHGRLNTIDETISEIAGAIGTSKVQISSLIEKVAANAPASKPQVDMISAMRTQLSAKTALLNEALKVGYKIFTFTFCNYLLSRDFPIQLLILEILPLLRCHHPPPLPPHQLPNSIP